MFYSLIRYSIYNSSKQYVLLSQWGNTLNVHLFPYLNMMLYIDFYFYIYPYKHLINIFPLRFECGFKKVFNHVGTNTHV